ncbi:hypothetical protein BH18CHL1_BH18CHL1_00410 [soil metagenome]
MARDRTAFDEPLSPAPDDATAKRAAVRLADRLADVQGQGQGTPPRPREIQAMAVIHEAMHQLIAQHRSRDEEPAFHSALAAVAREVGPEALEEALRTYAVEFPVAAVYQGVEAPDAYLEGATSDRPHREHVLEELLLLWLTNRNPAFTRHGDLFDDTPVAEASLYADIVESLHHHLAPDALADPGDDLVARLLAPAQAAPGSLAGQLRYIRQNWPGVSGLIDRLAPDLDRLAAQERGQEVVWDDEDVDDAGVHGPGLATPPVGAAGPGPADAQALHGFAGLDDETEAYSPDRDWMPRLVLIAKSTYVWLDQLSHRYGRAIRTLDAVPDEELEALAAHGFSGLWLIGLWQRSHASQVIKQRRGDADAVASAYSLMDYRISDDLGGEEAFAQLRGRAMARGIRLACDMVPNHMGLDSRWVMDHPDRFISRPDSPFPAYTFSGPNLSADERVGIYLEDHYDDRSDAAVVFKRVERWNGEQRYVYHGNDGTGTAWNDTAQLDYLRADVREAVMDAIIAVCRRAPIIRFDAAMTLARRHVQRLWYPLPGHGESIPSRADAALSGADFAARMPREFWREVVDRVAAEAPDTLLLAEAFWLMEGYFVRTLGMHRVYNSAFMHMLRDEDNAGYRTVLRNTLAFDPEILQRYVDFMTNPDERTAIDQFGDGDKAFGVATVMATLPGLPMFGHGQVEGFTERYGMEFQRARLDEQPDEGHVARHDREIAPLLHQRSLFAGAGDFRLYDVALEGGGVADDVFAYSNRQGDRRALIIYHNRFAEVRGVIGRSVPASVPAAAGDRTLVTSSIAEALGVPDEAGAWLILHDSRSGREWLHHGRTLHQHGLPVTLSAYECRVFLDPQVVRDDGGRRLAQLARRLGDRGAASIDAAISEELLVPARSAMSSLLDATEVRATAGAALVADGQPVAPDEASVAGRLALIGDLVGDTSVVPEATAALSRRSAGLMGIVRAGRARSADRDIAAAASWLGTDRARWASSVAWMRCLSIAVVLGESAEIAADPLAWMVGWGIDEALQGTAGRLGADEHAAARVVELTCALIAISDDPLASVGARAEALAGPTGTVRAVRRAEDAVEPRLPWLDGSAARRASQLHESDGHWYVDRDAFDELVEALLVREVIDARQGPRAGPAIGLAAAAAAIKSRVEAAGWRVRVP